MLECVGVFKGQEIAKVLGTCIWDNQPHFRVYHEFCFHHKELSKSHNLSEMKKYIILELPPKLNFWHINSIDIDSRMNSSELVLGPRLYNFMRKDKACRPFITNLKPFCIAY